MRAGHGIKTLAIRENFFAFYASALLSQPTFFRRIVDDGRILKMAKDLTEAAQGPLGTFLLAGTDLFWASINGRVRKLSLRDGSLISDRFQIRIDLESDSLARELRKGTLVPGLFVIFLIGSLIPKIRFLGGAYQTVYHEFFQRVLRRHLCSDKYDEKVFAADMAEQVLVGWGHNVIQDNTWGSIHVSSGNSLRFSFADWEKPLFSLSSNFASFTQDLRWLALVEIISENEFYFGENSFYLS